jgi:hypothetical protein
MFPKENINKIPQKPPFSQIGDLQIEHSVLLNIVI